MEKKIFSINLAMWLHSKGHEFECGIESGCGNLVYFVFEDSDAVKKDIEDYKSDEGLQEFIRAGSPVRQAMRKAQGK